MACGNRQARDELDLYSPTPRLSTVRVLLHQAVNNNWAADVSDVSVAFLNSRLPKPIYCHLPAGRQKPGEKRQVMRCQKALYGIPLYAHHYHDAHHTLVRASVVPGAREAPRMWHDLLHNWFVAGGFEVNPHDCCLYTRWQDGQPLHCLVHVDDVLMVGSQSQVDTFKADLAKSFAVTGGDPIKMYLGMEFTRNDAGFTVSQEYIIEKLLVRAGKHVSNASKAKVPMRCVRLDKSTSPVTEDEKLRWKEYPFRSYLGAIGYVMLGTAPHLAHAYCQLSRFNNSYGKQHWDALIELLAYVRNHYKTDKMHISRGAGNNLVAYCDADWNASYDSKSRNALGT